MSGSGAFALMALQLSGRGASRRTGRTARTARKRDVGGAKYTRWSENEIDFISKHFRSMGAAWCAEKTGRSLSAVQTRAYMLRLRGRLE